MDPTVVRDNEVHEIGLGDAWAANLKSQFDQFQKRNEEMDSHFDKLIVDSQSAANLALLNAVNNADLLSKQAIRHADLVAANELQEQVSESDVTIDDIGKVMSSSTEHLAEVFTTQLNALTAQIMTLTIALTGRPPVTAPAVEGSASSLK